MKLDLLYSIVNYLVLINVITIIVGILEYLITTSINYIPFLSGILLSLLIFVDKIRRYIGIEYLNFSYSFKRFIIFILIFLMYTLNLVIYLYKYPIFPSNYSGDFLVYTTGAFKLYGGTYNNLFNTNDLAVYLPIASLYSLFNGVSNILSISRIYIFFLNIIAFLEIYILAIYLYNGYLSELTIFLFTLTNYFIRFNPCFNGMRS